MHARGTALLLTAMLAVSFQVHATPNTTAIAANKAGQAIVLSTSNDTLVVKVKPAAAPVKAQLTCVKTVRYVTGIYAPPLPTVPWPTMRLFASARAGNKWYYVNLFSAGAPAESIGQAVVALGVSTSSSGSALCGASTVTTTDAAGVLINR